MNSSQAVLKGFVMLRLLVMDLQTKLGQECLLHQQSYLDQSFGEWVELRPQYKIGWDFFRYASSLHFLVLMPYIYIF